jgi:hypothetical protein
MLEVTLDLTENWIWTTGGSLINAVPEFFDGVNSACFDSFEGHSQALKHDFLWGCRQDRLAQQDP